MIDLTDLGVGLISQVAQRRERSDSIRSITRAGHHFVSATRLGRGDLRFVRALLLWHHVLLVVSLDRALAEALRPERNHV
jgi:hypothetical protein